MALTIQPADALIQRLLQHSNTRKPAHTAPPQSRAIADQVSISNQARQASQMPSTPQNDNATSAQSGSKQASLEDRILRMYGEANQRHEPES